MPNPTPAAQVAALAALFGITPETHRHLFTYKCPECNEEIETIDGTPYCGCGDRSYDDAVTNIPHHPDPLGPDADGVWLAPAVKWLKENSWMHWVGWGQAGDDLVFEAGIWFDENKDAAIGKALTATAALLQACLAARVPEIGRAMEGEA